MEIKSLIEQIEKSDGADREIDALIYHDLLGFCRHARKVKTGAQSDTGFDCLDCGADSWGNKSREGGYPAGQGLHDSAPNYTASIDAAMTLVPEGCGWFIGWGQTRIGEPMGGARITRNARFIGHHANYDTIAEAEAATPALAICAAALKARNPSHEG